MLRAVSHDLNTNLAWDVPVEQDIFGNYRDSLFHSTEMTVDKFPAISGKVVVPLASPMDQIAASSLMKFITKFGTKTMIIYDALLQEKRILFAGALDFPINQIQDYVFAAASLISQPLIGVQSKVYPYAPLQLISTLEHEPGYVAGVTNLMYLMNKKCHDVSCRVDEGKISSNIAYSS